MLKLNLSSSDSDNNDELDELQRLKREQEESTYSHGDRETLEQYEKSQKSRTFHESSSDKSKDYPEEDDDENVSPTKQDANKPTDPTIYDASGSIETRTYDPRGESVQNVADASSRLNRLRYILCAFKERRNPQLTIEDYKEILFNDLNRIYGLSDASCKIIGGLLGFVGLIDFAEALDKQPVQTLRANSLKIRRKDLAAMLISKGAMVEPLSFSDYGLACYRSQVPLGATSEYLRGYYMLQDAASLLPVMALSPEPGEVILDAAAAPGGKTSHICSLMKNQGVLIANDTNPTRIKALQANLARMGCWNVIVTNTDTFGIKNGGFDRILLDAPCTGLGLMQKDVRSRASRDFKDLQKMQQLQRRLLDHCIGLLKRSGGGPKRLIYSTCSISIAENEAVVDYVVRKRGDCKIVDTGLPEGLGLPGLTEWKEHSFMTSMKLARRFYPHIHNVIGFFVCAIQLTDNKGNQEAAKGKKK